VCDDAPTTRFGPSAPCRGHVPAFGTRYASNHPLPGCCSVMPGACVSELRTRVHSRARGPSVAIVGVGAQRPLRRARKTVATSSTIPGAASGAVHAAVHSPIHARPSSRVKSSSLAPATTRVVASPVSDVAAWVRHGADNLPTQARHRRMRHRPSPSRVGGVASCAAPTCAAVPETPGAPQTRDSQTRRDVGTVP